MLSQPTKMWSFHQAKSPQKSPTSGRSALKVSESKDYRFVFGQMMPLLTTWTLSRIDFQLVVPMTYIMYRLYNMMLA